MIMSAAVAWPAVAGGGTHGKLCVGVRPCGLQLSMRSQAGARPFASGAGKRSIPLAKQATSPGAARAPAIPSREVMQRCAGTGPADLGPRRQAASAGIA